MSFNFGTPKTATATGFTLPTTSAPTAAAPPNFQFSSNTGAGDATAAAKPTLGLFGAPASSAPGVAATPNFSYGTSVAKTTGGGLTFGSVPSAAAAATTAAPSFGFGVPAATATTTTTTVSSAGTTAATSLGLNLLTSTATTTAATSLASFLAATTSTPLSFGLAAATTTATTTTAATTSAPPPSFGFSTATATTSSTGLQLPTSTTTATSQPATTSAAATATTIAQSVLPQTSTLTFTQLEDSINKWTIQMEDQLKIFMNQARQLTAWDRLLISNGEKIVNISNGLEGIKQQQQQLDHELDFVLSQQKELEDLIVPLEKELAEVPIHDHDRFSIYQIAETLDSQLKQMSDDLNQAIEHINEVAKNQSSDDPISQIAKILNAHMNSLQWIDRNTAQINNHLEQVSKMQEQLVNFRG